jgi:type I restriction enzyme R subunit
VDDNEGNELLLHTNQLLIASSFDEARVGSVGAGFRHFAAWKTVVRADGQGTEADVAAALCKGQLSEQERLVAGLLAPANLLDVVRHFTLFMTAEVSVGGAGGIASRGFTQRCRKDESRRPIR